LQVFEELAEKIIKNRQVDTFDYDQLIATLKSKLKLHSDYKKIKEKKLAKTFSLNLFDANKSAKSSFKLSDHSLNESITSSVTHVTDHNDVTLNPIFKHATSDVNRQTKNEVYQSSPIKHNESPLERKNENKFEVQKSLPKSQSVYSTRNVANDDESNESMNFQNLKISKSDNQISIKTDSPVNISIQSRDRNQNSESSPTKPKSATHQLLEKFNQQRQNHEQAPFKLQLLIDILKNQFNVLNMQVNSINGEICALNTVINSIKSRF
jgi:hypothetical protein